MRLALTAHWLQLRSADLVYPFPVVTALKGKGHIYRLRFIKAGLMYIYILYMSVLVMQFSRCGQLQ